MLDQLKRKGYMTAVVSNKPDPAVGVLCKKYFGDLIDVALGDKEGILRKPSAEPVKYAIEKLGCESAVFVGDTEVDVATAKNAGLDCIAMTWGFRDRDQLEASGATVFADDADELMTHILSLLGE
jgi:phosphoglycolate phosphatase